jgi:hypothetical protein
MMVQQPEIKKCSQCELEKSLDNFPFENKELNVRRANCKDCKNAASKKAYEDTRDEPESVARRIIKKCKEREKYRLAKFIQRQDGLDVLPEVELTDKEFDLDYLWVLNQRDIQNNKCFYTDRDMIWSTGLIDEIKRINPDAVTVERLDSARPYVKDNCVLACWRANCMKGDGTYNEMIIFCSSILHKHINEKLF